jgi:hypothetical protein
MRRVSVSIVLTLLLVLALAGAMPGAVYAQSNIDLSPTSGFSCITISGQGFVGQVTIYWAGKPISTVPSPVDLANDGTFTAIITVPTQTKPGDYTIRADGLRGTTASARFTVVDMTGATGPAGPAGPEGTCWTGRTPGIARRDRPGGSAR